MSRTAVLALGATAALALALPGGATAASTTEQCAQAAHPAGEWSTYGADLRNTRSQPKEKVIGVATAGSLKPAFVYEAPGLINSTPIVDGGCVFIFSQGATPTSAHAAALDADSGEPIWERTLTVGTAAFGGPAVSTPALTDDTLIVSLNKQAGPVVLGLDRVTGVERWRTTIDEQPNSGVNGSPVVVDGLIFQGFFGNADAAEHERGGFVLLDAATGTVVKKTFVIGDDDFAAGYAGAGIWSTPAIDTSGGYAYTGTSNPHNPQMEHPRSDSILKIDLDRDRATFGEIVASYKGVNDTLVPGAADQPVCDTKPDVYYSYSFSVTCLAVDLDFGASPNLFADSAGNLRVGELQKSGVYHIIDAQNMASVARTPVGVPCFACNAASSAFSGGQAFVAGGPPGEMVAVGGDDGLPAWASPIAGGFTYNPVSVANGVVWSVDSSGFLDAFDASTGAPVLKRRLQDDTGVAMNETTTSSGIAIARNTLYTAATSFVLAYRPSAAARAKALARARAKARAKARARARTKARHRAAARSRRS